MGLKIGRFLGNVAKGVISATPAGRIINAVAPSLLAPSTGGGGGTSLVPGLTPSVLTGVPRLGAGPGTSVVPVSGRVSPLGTVGMCPTDIVYTKAGQPRRYRLKKGGGCTWHKRPTMNVMNPRAASHAIARLKGARKLLQRIERSMPHRASHAKPKRCGCK